MPTVQQPILVNGDVLAWARKRWGLDRAQAAAKLGLTESRLAEYESGTHTLDAALLEEMTRAYQLSMTNLILRAPPPERNVATDFRAIPGQTPRRTPELVQAITTTLLEQEAATDLANDLGRPVAMPPWITTSDAEASEEEVGRAIRERLGVTDEIQRQWNDPAEAFRQWRRRVEAQGVLVFRRKLTPPQTETPDCRGFASYAEELLPAITINTNESDQAQCFTLLHELAHLLRRESGICDEAEDGDSRQIEQFCNRSAAAALMPRSLVEERISAINAKGLPSDQDWSETDLKRLARALNLSRPAVAIRLEQLQLARPDLLHRLGVNRNDGAWLNKQQGGFAGSAPYARRHINRLGSLYVGLVFDALDQGLLDLTDADYHFDLRAKHFDPLRAELASMVSESAN